LKILLVGSDKLGSEYGGGQVYLKNLVIGLTEHQHDVSYLSITFADISLPKRMWSSFATIKELQLLIPATWRAGCNPAGKSHITDKLASVFREVGPDIVHAHGWKKYSCIAARMIGVPCVVTAHHGGIVCPAGALLNAEDEICRVPVSDLACLKCCIRSVPGWRLWFPLLSMIPLKVRLWIGNRLGTVPFIPFLTPFGIISCSIRDKIQAVRDIGQSADRVIAPSPAIADAFVRNGVPEQKVAVVPHGIPLPGYQPLSPDFGDRPLRFIYLGRINHVKGVHVMLRAFKDLQPETYVLHIVGNAVTKSEKRYLKGLQRDFSSVSAVWHGGIPHVEIPDFIASCDVMVHPAICLEVYGLTIAESLAVGRPVIATRCGGAEVQIRDGENGVLIPPNDPGALSDALLRFIEDHSLILKMSRNTGPVRKIEEHVNDLVKLYRQLISRDNSVEFS
jgi:glycosyltransferase involved in cell wall biosynthesis